MPNAIVNWQLELAAEVRRCPLLSRAGKEEEQKEEEEKQPLIKSNNPHLAGGESSKMIKNVSSIQFRHSHMAVRSK